MLKIDLIGWSTTFDHEDVRINRSHYVAIIIFQALVLNFYVASSLIASKLATNEFLKHKSARNVDDINSNY